MMVNRVIFDGLVAMALEEGRRRRSCSWRGEGGRT